MYGARGRTRLTSKLDGFGTYMRLNQRAALLLRTCTLPAHGVGPSCARGGEVPANLSTLCGRGQGATCSMQRAQARPPNRKRVRDAILVMGDILRVRLEMQYLFE